MGRTRGALTPERLAQYAREDRCVALRLAGASLATLAAQAGYTHRSAARKALLRAVRRGARDAGAETLRQLEEARLDRLLLAVWGRALAGDLAAFDRALRNIALRIRILGLDAPIRVQHAGAADGPPRRPRATGPVLDLERLTEDEVHTLERLHAKASGSPLPADDEHDEVPLLDRLLTRACGEAPPAD